jgi:hypothetical protein
MSSSSLVSRRPSRGHIEIEENGQRKRKIARFPCDRHPISIGGHARHRPSHAAAHSPACVWGTPHAKLGAIVLGLLV